MFKSTVSILGILFTLALAPYRAVAQVVPTDPVESIWQSIQETYPNQRGERIFVPGMDVRILLGKFLPDLDRYLQEVVDQLDEMQVTRSEGKITFDARLSVRSLQVALRDEKQTTDGQVYAFKLYRHLKFDLHLRGASVEVENIEGLKLLIKLPWMPDGVYPLSVSFNTNNEVLTLTAQVIGKLFWVAATADVKGRHFTGVDWIYTLLLNLPFVMDVITFSAK